MASAGPIRYASLTVNCGFARAAIRELTPCNRKDLKLDDRATKFHSLYKGYKFAIPDDYFTYKSEKKSQSQFNRDSEKILKGFATKWHPHNARREYEQHFSIAKWHALSAADKSSHTLSNCTACFTQFYEQQKQFPLKPIFQPSSVLTFDQDMVQQMPEKQLVQATLDQLDQVFQEGYHHSFTEAAIKHGKRQLERKRSKNEKKKERRTLLKKCRDEMTTQLTENTPMMVLAENESLNSYKRKRALQTFEEAPSTKKCKTTHSPNFETVEWDKGRVLDDLQSLPQDQTPINWSKFAKEHGVKGSNAGQIVKELATSHGIDTYQLDRRTPTRKKRCQKKRLPGGEISVPTNLTPQAVKKSWDDLIDSGELILGEPCSPYTLTRYTTKEGKTIAKEVTVYGRKIPLATLREKLLKNHTKFMRLLDDHAIAQLTREQLLTAVRKVYHTVPDTTSTDELQTLLAKAQRQRCLVLWHDHATILSTGFLMITVHTLYDPAVFLTNSEYQQYTQSAVDVQTEVEKPEIYMLALGSSSIEDQAAVLPDRIDCLHDLAEPVVTTSGIRVYDTLRFFIGDHPAAQFEKGTQMGGRYKCGGCGCKAELMDDQAHALRCRWRSTADLQSIAIGGVFGKQPRKVKPMCNLPKADLVRELRARKFYDLDQRKDILQKELETTLKGVQRVPSLLLLHPEQPLGHLNLQHYTILDSEPLHDLKGHLLHLFDLLPSILPPQSMADCETRIRVCLSKDKISGADLRTTLIDVFMLLIQSNGSNDTQHLLLLRTIIRVSEVLYSSDEERTPRQVLQLYNNTWLHHELCRDLLTNVTSSRTNTFGIYLHALSTHAPQQYELVTLKSVNTENQERLFGQARRIAAATSSRKPAHMITNTLLRLQAKQKVGNPFQSTQKAYSQVRRAATGLPSLGCTEVKKQFISKRKHSWQAHLERISPFLLAGKGIWWQEAKNGSSYLFFDGNDKPDYHLEGPQLLHFRNAAITDVITRQNESWQTLLEGKIQIPAESIRNDEGKLITQASTTDLSLETNPDLSEKANDTPAPHVPAITQTGDQETDTESQAREPDTNDATDANDSEHQTDMTEPNTHHDTDDIEQHTEMSEADTHHSATDLEHQTEIKEPDTHHDAIDTESIATGNKENTIPNYQDQSNPKSTLCIAISKVVGIHKDLIQLDNLHLKLKQMKQSHIHPPQHFVEQYEGNLAQFKQKILKQRAVIRHELSTYERDYYAKHQSVPTEADSPHFRRLITKRNLANKLLQSWGIKL